MARSPVKWKVRCTWVSDSPPASSAAQEEVSLLERQAGITEERARVAREIHDTIAQSLTGLVMTAQRASSIASSLGVAGQTPQRPESAAEEPGQAVAARRGSQAGSYFSS